MPGEGGRALETGRAEWLDLLRVGSMFAVVLIHVAVGSLGAKLGSGVWHFANISTAFAGTAVPVFFMISGALLLDSPRTSSLGHTFKHRFLRIFVPFLAWSFVGVAYFFFMGWALGHGVRLDIALRSLVGIPETPTIPHLWFMYALLPLYILSPLIKAFVDGAGMRLVGYALILWVFFASLLPTAATFLPPHYRPLVSWGGITKPGSVVDYAGYFLAGYYLMKMKRQIPVWLLATVALVAGSAITLLTWGVTARTGVYTSNFKMYIGAPNLILSIAVFLMVKELFRHRSLGRKGARVVAFLAPLSFCVYLCHYLICNLIFQVLFRPHSVATLIAAYLVVTGLSVAFAAVVTNIKGLSYILAGQKYRRRPVVASQLVTEYVD